MSMSVLNTLPGVREQIHHTLVLLGAPASSRLIVDVHAALFDGDLSMSALATALRDEERQYDPDVLTAYRICPALHPDLSAAHGLVTLSGWPVERRFVTPARSRRAALAMVIRIAEFVHIRAAASPVAIALLRRLADTVPGGTEAFLVQDPRALADAARAALAEIPAENAPAAILARWELLDERQRLFGVMSLPHQRGRA